jgi:hypothetical protein
MGDADRLDAVQSERPALRTDQPDAEPVVGESGAPARENPAPHSQKMARTARCPALPREWAAAGEAGEGLESLEPLGAGPRVRQAGSHSPRSSDRAGKSALPEPPDGSLPEAMAGAGPAAAKAQTGQHAAQSESTAAGAQGSRCCDLPDRARKAGPVVAPMAVGSPNRHREADGAADGTRASAARLVLLPLPARPGLRLPEVRASSGLPVRAVRVQRGALRPWAARPVRWARPVPGAPEQGRARAWTGAGASRLAVDLAGELSPLPQALRRALFAPGEKPRWLQPLRAVVIPAPLFRWRTLYETRRQQSPQDGYRPAPDAALIRSRHLHPPSWNASSSLARPIRAAFRE